MIEPYIGRVDRDLVDDIGQMSFHLKIPCWISRGSNVAELIISISTPWNPKNPEQVFKVDERCVVMESDQLAILLFGDIQPKLPGLATKVPQAPGFVLCEPSGETETDYVVEVRHWDSPGSLTVPKKYILTEFETILL